MVLGLRALPRITTHGARWRSLNACDAMPMPSSPGGFVARIWELDATREPQQAHPRDLNAPGFISPLAAEAVILKRNRHARGDMEPAAEPPILASK